MLLKFSFLSSLPTLRVTGAKVLAIKVAERRGH
jgi:hypothetical protein